MRVKKNVVYFLGFLLGIHIALPAYITSNYLGRYLPETMVGWVYILGSVAALIMFSALPDLLRRFGNYKVTVALVTIEIFAMLAAATANTGIAAILAICVSLVSISLLGATMDVFLEHYSKDSSTGNTRGLYLISISAAWVIAQFILLFLIRDSEYWIAFTAAAFVLVPVSWIIDKNFSRFEDARYEHRPVITTLLKLCRNKDLFGIFVSNFLLQFFYTWMTIYIPLYLHNHLGFSLQEITFIAVIMLLPFVMFELPLGRIADKSLGEKEILVGGFIILAITSIISGTTLNDTVVFWMVLLFISRIGASMVEVGCETYFFKKIKDSNLGYISLFRTTRPWANIIAPAIAAGLIPVMGLQFIFIVLGLFMFYGTRFALSIRDTK